MFGSIGCAPMLNDVHLTMNGSKEPSHVPTTWNTGCMKRLLVALLATFWMITIPIGDVSANDGDPMGGFGNDGRINIEPPNPGDDIA